MVVQAKQMKQGATGANRGYGPVQKKLQDSGHDGNAHQEEGEGSWIFSYADLITILMMFFILMLSISNVSPEKFNALKEALKTDSTEAEKSTDSTESKQEVNKKESLMLADVALEELANRASSTGGDRSTRILAGAKILLEALDTEKLQQQKETYNEFSKLKQDLEESAKIINHGKLFQSGDTRKLSLEFPTSAFFVPFLNASDSPILVPKAAQFAAQVYASLRDLEPKPILEIESHSAASFVSQNSQNSQNRKRQLLSKDQAYTLTSKRAIALFELFEKQGIDPADVGLQGYGFARPVTPEFDRYGRTIDFRESPNDRIVIHLIRKPKETEPVE